MSERQATCEERIDSELRREVERIKEALRIVQMYDHECLNEECGFEWESSEAYEECPKCNCTDTDETERDAGESRDSYMDGLLEITPKITFKVGLSWGGPADGFYITVDPVDRSIDRIEYYFQDWFDGAVRTLSGDDFDTVSKMFDFLATDHEGVKTK
jgi:hypothetical protein